MCGCPLHLDWRPEDTVETLHDAYRAASNPTIKPRLHALWLRTGKTMAEVAPLVGFVYRSVQDWVACYRACGRAGLATTLAPPPPPPSHLTLAQWDKVRQHLRVGTTVPSTHCVTGWCGPSVCCGPTRSRTRHPQHSTPDATAPRRGCGRSPRTPCGCALTGWAGLVE